MAELYVPEYTLKINGFDVTNSVKPYLLNIAIDEVFDTEFTPTKLDLLFHAKYARSSAWKYKDTIEVIIWWRPYPDFTYNSGIFYIDYVSDIKSGGGSQTFRISALKADPNIGFSYGKDELVYTNKKTVDAVVEFANLFGLTKDLRISTNVYLGTKDNYNSGGATDAVIKFNSYAEMLKYICNTYGYLGSIQGTKLTLYRADVNYSSDDQRFYTFGLNEIFDFQTKQTYNQLAKEYQAIFYDRANSSIPTKLVHTPKISSAINKKIKKLEIDNAYYDFNTANERVYGEMFRDFYSGFEVSLTTSALNDMRAGKVFLLDASYGQHEGYYRCTKITHTVDSNGWMATISGFPLKVLNYTTATFEVGYTGRNADPDDPNKKFELSQLMGGRTYVLGANKFDEFAKYLNPDYNFNFGAYFLSEGNKSGNKIKPEFAFAFAMVESNAFKNNEVMSRKNVFGLDSAGSPSLATFSTFETGIRAGIQHMFAYAYTAAQMSQPADPIVDPRYNFVTRGIAPTLDELSGRFNQSLDLGDRIKAMIIELYKFSYPDWSVRFID